MTRGQAQIAGPRTGQRPGDVAEWLRAGPSLQEMCEAYPADWQRVDAEVARLVERGDTQEMHAYLGTLMQQQAPSPAGRSGRLPPRQVLISQTIRQQMAIRAVTQALLVAEAGVSGDQIALGRVNRRVIEKLFLTRSSRRKAVSSIAFRLVWPLLTQRRRLMPMMFQQGVYCFYSRSLLRGVADLIGGHSCLEIAAGDGTLTRLLGKQGAQVAATDDHSWDRSVSYGPDVAQVDARTALRRHEPEVVVCSWPPAGNTFEHTVFSTPSVQTYILITSTKDHEAGNWDAYRAQTGFEMSLNKRLSRGVLPAGSVYVFTRTPAPGARA